MILDYILKYHPREEAIPEDWILVDDMCDCHHGQYAVLIKYVGDEINES